MEERGEGAKGEGAEGSRWHAQEGPWFLEPRPRNSETLSYSYKAGYRALSRAALRHRGGRCAMRSASGGSIRIGCSGYNHSPRTLSTPISFTVNNTCEFLHTARLPSPGESRSSHQVIDISFSPRPRLRLRRDRPCWRVQHKMNSTKLRSHPSRRESNARSHSARDSR